MTTLNAIKKLEALRLKINHSPNTREYWVSGAKDLLTFHEQDGHLIIIKVQGHNDKDDPMTDYSGGVFCDNLTQALRMFDK